MTRWTPAGIARESSTDDEYVGVASPAGLEHLHYPGRARLIDQALADVRLLPSGTDHSVRMEPWPA